MKSNLESLANKALEYESENGDDSNILQLVRRFTRLYQVNQETQKSIETASKYGMQKQNLDFYNQVWKTEIAKLSKAESYLQSKGDIRFENYLIKIKNLKHRKASTCLQLSCHPLRAMCHILQRK